MSRKLWPVFAAAVILCGGNLAHAGQSLVLAPASTSSAVIDPNQSVAQSFRVEFQMHDWTLPASNSSVFDLNGIGVSAEITPGGTLQVIDKRDTASQVCNFQLGGLSNVLIRLSRDHANSQFVCELWNYDGTGYQQITVTLSAFPAWPYSGGKFGDTLTTARIGFFRIFSTLVPYGIRPPVTADTGDITELKFDGNVSDSSGNGHNVTFPGATFQNPTPNQRAVVIVKTLNTPVWSNQISFRAGFPGTLDGSSSFSMSDASAAVTYFWQVVSGPSSLIWSSRTVSQPTITGLIFGNYTFRLTVTDSAGNVAVDDLDVGAVSTDGNGVVVQADPKADILFGPMIAFGRNPWPYQDSVAIRSAQVRKGYIDGISPPGWSGNLPGTISYVPGTNGQAAQTTVAAPVVSTDSSISVADATKLDLSSFPTIVVLHPVGVFSSVEEVSICGRTGNTLQVCYDGRAWRKGRYQEVAAPQSWPSGTIVRQVQVVGTGTTFLASFCPAGAGEAGFVNYAAGTGTTAAGSTAFTGAGTAWTSALEGSRIRIAGTHSGTPFVFFSSIVSVGGPTSLTLARQWPADADGSSGLSYAILKNPPYMAQGWLRPDSTNGRQVMFVSACTSDTRIYSGDMLSSISGAQTSQTYGFEDGGTWFSEFGPNYYDEVLAHYASYYRSGNALFLNNARKIGDYLPTSPDLDEGWLGQIPRHVGATGMFAAAALDGRSSNWYTLRRLATQSVAYLTAANCDGDTRENAYRLSWLGLAALLDPLDTHNAADPNQKSYWKAQLANWYTYDNSCKGANSDFPQHYYNGAQGAFAMTNGSTTATGTAIPASLCDVTASGPITVANGSTAATGTGFVSVGSTGKIVVKGTRGGASYLFYSVFTYNSPGSITLLSPYDGDTGTWTYQIEPELLTMEFASDITDRVNGNKFYVCNWVDSTTITLDRPWEGATGTFNATRNVDSGVGQTVFLAGVKATAMKWAAQGATGPTATNYAALDQATVNWILTKGYDPVTRGLYYKRDFGFCELPIIYRMNCAYGPDPSSEGAARTLSGEAQNAMSVAYQLNPTPANLAFGDQFYGAQWGKPGYGTPPWSDGIYLAALDDDATFSYKWIGFLFGMGMSHQWPAVRVGGVAPANLRVVPVRFDLSSVPNATSVDITITAPSGAASTTHCTVSPCDITADARQGAHMFQTNYESASGAVLAQSDPSPFDVN